MKIIKKIRSMLEERCLWKGYLITNRAAEYIGKLFGARPYFMSFDKYKKQRADGENVLTLYNEKPAIPEGYLLADGSEVEGNRIYTDV